MFGDRWEPAEGTVVDYKWRQTDNYGGVVDWWIIDVRLPSGEVVRSKVYPPRYEPSGWINPMPGERVRLEVAGAGRKVRLNKSDPARSRQAGERLKAQQLAAELDQAPSSSPDADRPLTRWGGGDVKAQILRVAAENPESVIPEEFRPAAGPAADPVERLAKLAALRTQGLLTDEEYAAAKAKLLGT